MKAPDGGRRPRGWRAAATLVTSGVAALLVGLVVIACSACCLLGDTLILTPDGPRPLASLRPGDEVYSYDRATGRLVTNRVQRTFTKVSLWYAATRFADGRTLGATLDHRVFDPSTGRYEEVVDARSFACVGPDGGAFTADADFEQELAYGLTTLYDLGLEREPHNYVANGILVHNHKQHHVYDVEGLVETGLNGPRGLPLKMIAEEDVPAVVEVELGQKWAFQAGSRGGNVNLLTFFNVRADHPLYAARVADSSTVNASATGGRVYPAHGGAPTLPLPGFGELGGRTGLLGVLLSEDGGVTGTGEVTEGSFLIDVTDGDQLDTKTITLARRDATASVTTSVFAQVAPPTVPLSVPPEGVRGEPYTFVFPVHGGTPPYTWSGTLSSTPSDLADDFLFTELGCLYSRVHRVSSAGTLTLTVTMRDSRGEPARFRDASGALQAERTVTIEVREPSP